jgi:thioredoxin 1
MPTRRKLLKTGLALGLLPLTSLPLAARAEVQPYTPGLAEQAMRDGERIFLMFSADWCSTCARQERIISDLRAANPAYDRELTIIRVDWDQYGTGDLARAMAVPRRSTLIALRGETELARIIAGTSETEIKGLMDRALAG